MQPDRERIVRAALVSLADDIATLSEQLLPAAEIAAHFRERMALIERMAAGE